MPRPERVVAERVVSGIEDKEECSNDRSPNPTPHRVDGVRVACSFLMLSNGPFYTSFGITLRQIDNDKPSHKVANDEERCGRQLV